MALPAAPSSHAKRYSEKSRTNKQQKSEDKALFIRSKGGAGSPPSQFFVVNEGKEERGRESEEEVYKAFISLPLSPYYTMVYVTLNLEKEMHTNLKLQATRNHRTIKEELLHILDENVAKDK